MKREDFACEALDTINRVWDIWGTTLPIVWHSKAKQITAILTPPDDDSRVLCVLGSKRYFLVDIADLRPIKKGAAIVLSDGRRGVIHNIALYSLFFLFEDDANGANDMVAVADIAHVADFPSDYERSDAWDQIQYTDTA